jgi:predicted helicase
MATTAIERLRDIKTLPQLVSFLRDELDWPISSNNTEDITFDYEPSELGLDKETAVKIKEIKQLRPLTGNQPWGIFFVNFEKKRLPVMVMRRILRSLVFKKRTAPGKSDRQAWHASDLLFISAYGEEHDRAITFAHFVEDEELGGLAELRVLGWDDDDTPLKYDYVAHTLYDKFAWRGEFERDPDAWRTTWRNAFELRHREVITTSRQLALSLAALAKKIRSRVRSILRYEDAFGQIRKLQTAFRKALIHDLSDDDFADMYAQTITYGLFSAAVSRPAGVQGENIVDMVPVTNPFLRDMLETFLNLSGRKGKIDFDELGIQEVVALLNSGSTHLDAVLRDFGNRTQREDPVIHFYQDFLQEYDPDRRINRGVFYTPKPVVSYIVRSVHELLQSEFKLEDGLADTTTWGEMVRCHPGLKLPNLSGDSNRYQPLPEREPFVQILDPAVGTATFLVEVIDVIYQHLENKWREGGFKAMPALPATSFPRQPSDFSQYWNQYVALSLLRRLHGYELMMAPYAIAHMKIGLKLWETGYRFGADERARIYLTNSLEPPQDFSDRLAFDAPALAHEAKAVNEVKRHHCFTVIVANPPYSIQSQNLSATARAWADAYRQVDGVPIVERNALQFERNLQDDYVKFLSMAQSAVETSGAGIVSFISNHGYIDSPTFRGMRWSLLQSFPFIRVLDLHGASIKQERCPDGSKDENVFDIQQGVAIGTFANTPRKADDSRTYGHADLWGRRTGSASGDNGPPVVESKYDWLAQHAQSDVDWAPFVPQAPFFLFIPQDSALLEEYNRGWQISDAMPQRGAGIVTARDNLVIGMSARELVAKAEVFQDRHLSDAAVCARLEMSLKKGWNMSKARASIRGDDRLASYVKPLFYRPLDSRLIFYHSSLVWGMSFPTMRHMLAGSNIGLCISRSVRGAPWRDALVTNRMIEFGLMATRPGNSAPLFPLYLYGDPSREDLFARDAKTAGPPRQANFAPQFINDVTKVLHLTFTSETAGDLVNTISAEDVLRYIYAVLYAPSYRRRFEPFLKIDFPRLRLTGNVELFRALGKLGGELVALHLLESPKLDQPITDFIGGRNPEVEKVSWSKNTVWIDKAQTTGFRGVPEDVWNFHIGGYQVCEKWLKDRKGRTLSKDDIAHYHKIVIALAETIRLMKEIDEVIDKHGGWPGAFAAETAKEQ